MTLKLDYLPPEPAISNHVSAFYSFAAQVTTISEIERADLAQLRFHLEGDGHLAFAGRKDQPFFRVSLLGPRMRASCAVAKGPIMVFGMGLLPEGWAVMTGLDASACANQVLDGEAVLGGYLDGVFDRLKGASSFEEMTRIFSENHVSKPVELHGAAREFIRTVDGWLESGLNPEVATLLDQSRLSQRTLERMAKKFFGASPKQLARKYRALRAANAIVHGDGPWQDYANELYYDHSHCIRDIKEIVGVTPAQLRDPGNALLNLTFGRRVLAGRIADLSALS